MAGTNIVTSHIPVSTGDVSTSSRFFSRLARSPTNRKHRARSSITIAGADAAGSEPPTVPAIDRLHRQPSRPSLGRNITAPDSRVTLVVPPDITLSRSYSDGRKDSTAHDDGIMLDIGLSAAMLRPAPQQQAGKNAVPDVPQPPPVLAAIPNNLYQQVHDHAAKRMATFDYMRKAHEGKKFWFNCVHFSKTDVSKLPSYAPSRLSRRATNYLLLGLSIPAVLDVHPQPHPNNSTAANSALALDMLRSLNILLAEFEAYQTLHPVDGSHVSSLSRARIPHMFKRAGTTSRPRKSSGAPEVSHSSQISPPAMPDGSNHMSAEAAYASSAFASSTPTLVNGSPATPLSAGSYPVSSAFPLPGPADAANSTILPNEGPYTHLLTPSIPFTPDFYSVFATLCDVLLDVYQRLLQLINSPITCTVAVAESFAKADARIRKVIVGGIARDFEGQARENARKELLGVQKVVLGGLMGV